MPYPFNQQNQFTGAQYASPTPSVPTGGITYPGFGGGVGGNTPGITYPAPGGGGYNNPITYNSGLNNPLSQNLNVNAGSRGINNVTGLPIPDFRYANQNTLNRLNINDLIYSPSAGGYLQQGVDYRGLGNNFGGDPTANRRAAAFYGYIGSLPTRPLGTGALNQFYQNFGGGPTPGPSYNSILSNFFANQPSYVTNLARQGGFSPNGYTGPYGFGQSTNYNRFGLGY